MKNHIDADNSSDSPPQVSAIGASGFRRGTTALGVAVVVLGSLGVLCTSLFLAYLIFKVPPSAPAHRVNVINCAIAVVEKIGLSVLGILILRRRPQVYAIGAFVVSMMLLGWSYYLVAVPPVDRSHLHPQIVAALNIGEVIGNLLSILIYGGIFVYVVHPATRREFGITRK